MLTKDRAFYRTFVRLCATLMLEQAVILSVNLVDNLMLGAYSEAALSGVAAVNQIQFVLQQLVYAANNAMIVLGSQYWGQKRVGEVRRLSSIGLRAALFIALTLFLLVSFFPVQTLNLFTTSEAIAAEGVKYLAIIRFSYLFFAATTIMLGTMRIAESVRIALKVSLVSLVINVCVNYLLIAGHFGFPELGARGAAIGTLTARVVEFGLVASHLFTREKKLGLRPADYRKIDRTMLRDYVRVGLPVLVAFGTWGVWNALQTVILGHMSASAIAAQSISSTVFLLLKVTSVGASSAAAIIIGQAVGAGDMTRVRAYSRTLQCLFVLIGATLGLVMFLIRGPLLSAYRVSEETRKLANAYMLIQSVVLLTMSYEMPTNGGIISGGGDTRFAMILDLVGIWGIVMPLSFCCAFVWKLSPVPVIMCLNADQVFKVIPAFIRVNGYKWVKKLTRPEA